MTKPLKQTFFVGHFYSRAPSTDDSHETSPSYTFHSQSEPERLLFRKTIKEANKRHEDFYYKLLRSRSEFLNRPRYGHMPFSKIEPYNLMLEQRGKIVVIKKFQHGVPLGLFFQQRICENRQKMEQISQIFQGLLQAAQLAGFLPSFSNLFVNDTNQVALDTTSLIGIDLLVFQKPITRYKFLEIGMFLDRKIFERPSGERINHLSLIRFVGFYLLALALDKEIQLLFDEDVPERVGKVQATGLIAIIRQRVSKMLEMKAVVRKIQVLEKQLRFRISQFLRRVFLDEEQMSLSEAFFLLLPSKVLSEQEEKVHFLLLRIGIAKWISSTSYEKSYQVSVGLVSKKEGSEKLSRSECMMLAMRELNISLGIFTAYSSLESYLLDKNKLQFVKIGLWKNYLGTRYFSTLKSQGYEKDIFSSQKNQFKLIINRPLQKAQKNGQSNQFDIQMSASFNQKDDGSVNSPDSCKYNNQAIKRGEDLISLDEASQEISWERSKEGSKLDEIINIAKRQLTFTFQVSGSRVTVQQEMLKSLKKYQRLLG